MEMKKSKIPESKLILEGIEKAHQRMIEEKRRKGEQIAIMKSLEDKKIILLTP